ncbi:MAG: acyltransferase [Bacteroidetes bacterium]|nr:acyltransferase [Bacteroidota bacterium]
MLRKIVSHIAKKKNADFRLDPFLSNGRLFSFVFDKLISLIRSLKFIFCERDRMLFIGKGVRIRGQRSAHFGKAVQIGDEVQMTAWGKEGLSIGDYSWIGSYSFLKVSFSLSDIGKFISIGKNVGIGEFAHLGGAGGLSIGDDCIIGPYFSCHPENHRFLDTQELIRLQGTQRKGISIGKNCWIGAKVTILDGVHIGNNCIVAAGAVVNKDMPDNAVIGGVPARVIRRRSADEANISSKSMSA